MSTVSTRVHIRMPFVVGVLRVFLRDMSSRDFARIRVFYEYFTLMGFTGIPHE